MSDVRSVKENVDARLEDEATTDTEKKLFDERVRDYFGCQEKFDEIGVGDGDWGGLLWWQFEWPNTRFWPDLRTHVCWLALESELAKEKDESPMRASEEG